MVSITIKIKTVKENIVFKGILNNGLELKNINCQILNY